MTDTTARGLTAPGQPVCQTCTVHIARFTASRRGETWVVCVSCRDQGIRKGSECRYTPLEQTPRCSQCGSTELRAWSEMVVGTGEACGLMCTDCEHRWGDGYPDEAAS